MKLCLFSYLLDLSGTTQCTKEGSFKKSKTKKKTKTENKYKEKKNPPKQNINYRTIKNNKPVFCFCQYKGM